MRTLWRRTRKLPKTWQHKGRFAVCDLCARNTETNKHENRRCEHCGEKLENEKHDLLGC